jgi:O-antigen/teichoic acid export membrane protein
MHAAVSVAGAISVVMMPVLAWFVVSPEMVIELLFGQGRYDGADVVLRLLAFTALSWALRGVGEFVLLSEERASTFFAIAAAGSVATVVLGVPLILALESAGAAWAIVGAELLMTVALLRSARGLADRHARRAYAPAAAVAVATAVPLVLSRSSVAGSIGAVAVGTGVACLLGLRMVRRLERQP